MNQALETPVQTPVLQVASGPVPKLWLTPKDVAKLLSIGVRTLWRMVEAGQVPQPHRFSRKLLRWDRAELYDFVQNLRAAKAKEGQ